jgi:hypothetical protein
MSGFDFNTAMKYLAAFGLCGMLYYLVLTGKMDAGAFTNLATAALGGLGVHGVTIASKP